MVSPLFRFTLLRVGVCALAFLSEATIVSAQEADLRGASPPPAAVWLDQLDLSGMTSGFGEPVSMSAVSGNPISIGGVAFVHGVGTHADGEATFELDGKAERFFADVGIDDDISCLDSMGAAKMAAVKFRVYVDGKLAADSGVMKHGQPPKRLSVDLKGKKKLRLELKKQPGARFNHATWAGAAVVLSEGAALPKPLGTKAKPSARLSADETAILFNRAPKNVFFVHSLDLAKARFASAKTIASGRTPAGGPLLLGGQVYPTGFSVDGDAEIVLDLAGAAKRFVARVGIDGGRACEKVMNGGASRAEVWADAKKIFDSGIIHGFNKPVDISLDLTGVKTLLITSRLAEGASVPTTWVGAALVMDATKRVTPKLAQLPDPPRPAVARSRPYELGIRGPAITGGSPGKPFLFRIPATGKKPLGFAATGLPAGLELNATTGVIAGKPLKPGSHIVNLQVKDASGAEVTRLLKIEIGNNKLALTPPMGWNSWNVWGLDVSDQNIRRAADSLITSGLADHGFAFINIDDAWEGGRSAKGEIEPNEKFPNMVALSEYVHGKGLKMGIYSSPGPKTCGMYEGSYKHEKQDAQTYAKWGVDLLKYDWCSYGGVAKGNSRADLMKPYVLMGKALRSTSRDIVYSLCQYGMGDVWEWGREVGGHYWRTTGDIVDTWSSVDSIGFGHAGKERFAGPGGWNDPDMLVLGKVGWSKKLRDTRLTPAEQVTHMTLWSLLASPLLIGADLDQLDAWTLDLLTNDEVIAVNQDELGRAAARVVDDAGSEVWTRPLADGSLAVGVFNRGPVGAKVKVDLAKLGRAGKQSVRDLWQRQDLGAREGAFDVDVISHAALLFKVSAAK